MAFTNPNPTVTLVTADALKKVTAVGSAGPTDAGTVTTWWEVEVIVGATEVVYQIDKALGAEFPTVRNWTDTFTVPLGQSFEDKNIRFCMSASNGEFWCSAWSLMQGSNFDNIPVPVIPPEAAGTTFVPTTLQEQSAAQAARNEARQNVLKVASDSRYKLSRVVIDKDSLDAGPVFAPLPLFDMFFDLGTDYKDYRLGQRDAASLDLLAVRFFGKGREKLWWVIAYANGVIDVELDLKAGDVIKIPSNRAVRQFLSAVPEIRA